MAKHHFRVFALALLIVFMLVPLAACIKTTSPPGDHEQSGVTGGETAEDIGIGGETAGDIGIGGDFRECLVHSGYFHILDPFVGTLVSHDDFSEWSLPLRAKRTSPHDECLINLSTFIEHFGITREMIQQLIDDTRIDFIVEYNLDVLFSGDKELIEAYYDIKNEELHAKRASDREDEYYSESIMNLQRIVNKNASMSKHYHDIWTFASSASPAGKCQVYHWMQGLVEAGEYDRVNVVEFVQQVNFTKAGFERFVTIFRLDIYAHYNTDVIFSGDRQLIARYYSQENEAVHTAQVQAAFERYVNMYGQPDTSRRLD